MSTPERTLFSSSFCKALACPGRTPVRRSPSRDRADASKRTRDRRSDRRRGQHFASIRRRRRSSARCTAPGARTARVDGVSVLESRRCRQRSANSERRTGGQKALVRVTRTGSQPASLRAYVCRNDLFALRRGYCKCGEPAALPAAAPVSSQSAFARF